MIVADGAVVAAKRFLGFLRQPPVAVDKGARVTLAARRAEVDVRDERAAVHMAQAHAELTGELGVALVTAGPGMTNAITGIASAHVSRAPVLVLDDDHTTRARHVYAIPASSDEASATAKPRRSKGSKLEAEIRGQI